MNHDNENKIGDDDVEIKGQDSEPDTEASPSDKDQAERIKENQNNDTEDQSDDAKDQSDDASEDKETANEEESESWGDFFITILWALGIALVLRTFLFQPFHIPSGSMEPNLVQGDYIITSKYSVGYGKYAASPFPFPKSKGRLLEREPKRGDILVFRPVGNKKTYIKRLVGLPGDQIKLKNGVVIINNESTEQEFLRIETQVGKDGSGNDIQGEILTERFPNGVTHQIFDSVKNNSTDNISVLTVPYGHYFVLGDNRDRSADSRVIPDPNKDQEGAGYVPAENIIGRAEFVLLSAKPEFSIFKPWTWYHLRGDRFFKGLR